MEKYKYKPPTFWQRFKKEPLFALRLLYANIYDRIYFAIYPVIDEDDSVNIA